MDRIHRESMSGSIHLEGQQAEGDDRRLIRETATQLAELPPQEAITPTCISKGG